jgi:hypothetical protein
MNLVRRVANLEARPLLRIVPPEPVPVESPADVLAVMAEQINAVRVDAITDATEKARILGMLSSVALRAIEAKDLAARLEALERVLKLRRTEQEDGKKRKGWRGY